MSAIDPAVSLSGLERELARRWQRGLPLVPAPFAQVGVALDASEEQVIAALAGMQARGVLSRVGPVFRPGALGASTLAAMAVPTARLADVAQRVSRRPEVNHNYEREHRLNLWFVVTASDDAHVREVLEAIERETEIAVLALPLRRAYHIDLAFDLDAVAPDAGDRPADSIGWLRHAAGAREGRQRGEQRRRDDRLRDAALVAAIQGGLALTGRPYAAAGRAAGLTETATIARIGEWLEDDTIVRLGLVLRHRPLGFAANAMAVWDVPDENVDAIGSAVAQAPFVTLCYRRDRALPHWPYNLFCMVHGRDRDVVAGQLETLRRRFGLSRFAGDVLFSRTAYKQRGARYRFESRADDAVEEPAGG